LKIIVEAMSTTLVFLTAQDHGLSTKCHANRLVAIDELNQVGRIPSNFVPLTALRAFEAAASHHSLNKIAAELSVTLASVSLQIPRLEDLLGIRLFGHRILIDSAGERGME
jgi:hypothetical protein